MNKIECDYIAKTETDSRANEIPGKSKEIPRSFSINQLDKGKVIELEMEFTVFLQKKLFKIYPKQQRPAVY